MFVLFIIYPVVSIASMRAFNCDSNLGLLKDDYTMLCPPLSSFTCIYSAVFFVIYPIGIPFFMTASMRVMGMAQIVKEKMEKAQFSAMLSLFMKISCSVESQVWGPCCSFYIVCGSLHCMPWRTPMQLTSLCTFPLNPCVFLQRVARLVGNVDDDVEEFLRQTRHEFDTLVALQNVKGDFEKQYNPLDEQGKDGGQKEEGSDCIIVERLRAKSTCSSGMDGVGIGQLCTFFEQFDEDGDGQIDLEEFREMVQTSRTAANLFTGIEELAQINVKQMNTLLLFSGQYRTATECLKCNRIAAIRSLFATRP